MIDSKVLEQLIRVQMDAGRSSARTQETPISAADQAPRSLSEEVLHKQQLPKANILGFANEQPRAFVGCFRQPRNLPHLRLLSLQAAPLASVQLTV